MKKESKSDLSILLNLPRRNNNDFSIAEARKAVNLYVKSKSSLESFKDLCAKADFGKSYFATYYLVKELKQAAKEGMNLREYFKKGRPFKRKVVNKILVKGKK